ncbi:polysaccharide deacetylase [Actinosynnema sp. ALI-1.44]|uniref:polysaccharide deacetylase n=1 Tax=Actinosynnema sp. ALI-1.44 TaxID=1933779 RepID=UPI00097CB2E1|nr:polysaccharide deacetylase [Actinosynnema sp. ALI-1.44]ONI77708.1 polysaccharide deacetylase [Actinosynnema sp. ALI-1.44]
MGARGARNWQPITLGVALIVTFVILLVIGMRNPDATEPQPVAAATPGDWMRKITPGERPPQFVLFSYDGAGAHDQWRRLLDLAGKSNARFTAFLSGVYLLADDQRRQYTAPGHPQGQSSISFGGSLDQVRTRINDLNTAAQRGIEIGTHYNGHFCSPKWTTQQWQTELQQFVQFVDQAGVQGLKVDATAIRGGRLPCLEGKFDAVFDAMRSRGLSYDSSQVSDGVLWPVKEKDIWEFAMPMVRMPAVNNKKVTMVDYQLWDALNRSKDDKSKRDEFARATLEVYRAAYDATLRGNRAPLPIGNHFTDWAGGGFGVAAEQFMGEVCTKPETVCTTFSEVIKWMELQDPAVLDQLRKLPAAQT